MAQCVLCCLPHECLPQGMVEYGNLLPGTYYQVTLNINCHELPGEKHSGSWTMHMASSLRKVTFLTQKSKLDRRVGNGIHWGATTNPMGSSEPTDLSRWLPYNRETALYNQWFCMGQLQERMRRTVSFLLTRELPWTVSTGSRLWVTTPAARKECTVLKVDKALYID